MTSTPQALRTLTEAVLSSTDHDDVLDLLADAAHTELAADAVLLVLPLDGSTWICELTRGAAASELLGERVSRRPGGSAASSTLAYALAQGDGSHLETLTWADLSIGLAGRLVSPPERSTENARVLTMSINAGAARTGLLCAVRFATVGMGGTEVAAGGDAEPFAEAERITAASLASLFSFALNGATGRSAIEDDLVNERNRIARDLHDLAIQELFGVGMQLETVQERAKRLDDYSPDGPVANALRTSVSGIERSIAEIRAIVQSLRNETSDVTLSQRIRHEVAIATAGLGFAPSLQFHAPVGAVDEIDGELEEDIVAVVKECLANTARHAHASAVAVNISLFREGIDTVVQVNVSDNGLGIDPAVTRSSGLANMRSRARRHTGWVDFYPLDPGTMVSWRGTRFAT